MGGGGRYDEPPTAASARPAGVRLGAQRGALHIAPVGEGDRGWRLRSPCPRGALLGGDARPARRLGVDTPRSRRTTAAAFEDAGLVTMRPSTSHLRRGGAADIGITGRTCCRAAERDVYVLSISASAVPGWSSPPSRARTARPRRCGGSASCASRRSTRGSRAAYFERTGRQAEIVEVKGSVELAPLTGLVRGIVDLTATGTTLRENGLVVREEILASTARLIANPVAHKLKAPRSTTSSRAVREACAERARRARGAAAARGVRALVPPPARWPARGGDRRAVRERGDARCSSYERRFGGRRAAARARGELAAALDGARRRTCAPGWRSRSPTCARSPRPGSPRTRASRCRRASTVRLREVPVRRAAVYAPGGRTPYPSSVVMGAVTARAAGVARSSSRARRTP
jgi:ATP phosphoribosyltransferase